MLSAAQEALTKIVPAALVFMALAVAMKRDKVLAGLMAARREITTNLGLLLINTVVLVPLVSVPLMMFRDAIPRLPLAPDLWVRLPLVVVLITALLAMELAAYWRHRWEHSPVLWRIHATHHAD